MNDIVKQSAAEKAKRLVEKYQSVLSNFKQTDARRQRNYAKLCAIIAVDEILATSASEYEHEDNYWRSVKNEINKL